MPLKMPPLDAGKLRVAPRETYAPIVKKVLENMHQMIFTGWCMVVGSTNQYDLHL